MQIEILYKAARRENHAEVADLAPVGGVVHRVDGHLDHVLLGELEPVGPLQTGQPVEPGQEVIVVVEAERRLLGTLLDQTLQVRDVLDPEVPARLLARGDGVGVVAGGRGEPLYAVLPEVLPGNGLVLLPRIGQGIRLGKVNQPARGRVLPVEVYLAGLERLTDLLVAAESRLVDDRGVGRLEDLDGDVPEDLLLGEALGPDGELGVPLRAAKPELIPGDPYLIPA